LLAAELIPVNASVAGTALAAEEVLPIPGNMALVFAFAMPGILIVSAGPVMTPFVASQVGPASAIKPVDKVLVPDALDHMIPTTYSPGGKLAANG